MASKRFKRKFTVRDIRLFYQIEDGTGAVWVDPTGSMVVVESEMTTIGRNGSTRTFPNHGTIATIHHLRDIGFVYIGHL